MKSSIKLFLIPFLFTTSIYYKGIAQETIKPICTKIGKLNLSVDPRMELLDAAQILANYPVISKKPEKLYAEFLTFFEPYKEHAAVKTTIELFSKQRFSYDAPITTMLYLSQPDELKQVIPFSEYLIKRAGGNDNLTRYKNELRDFSVKTKFSTFWNQHLNYYKNIVNYTAAEIKDRLLIEHLESYYGMEQNSYNIILSPMFRGGKGPSIPSSNGKMDLFACLQTTAMKDSIPYCSIEDLYYFAWHEFGHSFVNPQSEKYSTQLNEYEYLYSPIKASMKDLAYTDWRTCVNEHIIRAIVIRMQEKYNQKNNKEINQLISQEHSKQFIYIDRILEKLKVYEKKRDIENTTFEQFYPELIQSFVIPKTELDSILEKFKFKGPINSIFQGKSILIYPTLATDSFPVQKIKEYVTEIQQKFYKNSYVVSDTEALKTNLSDYNIVVYGTMESNLWLKNYQNKFPFEISKDKVLTDKEYTGTNLKWITCLPNPQNKLKGLLIYTAQNQKDIININRFSHGLKDYYLFDSNNKTLIEGNYQKSNSKWSFN